MKSLWEIRAFACIFANVLVRYSTFNCEPTFTRFHMIVWRFVYFSHSLKRITVMTPWVLCHTNTQLLYCLIRRWSEKNYITVHSSTRSKLFELNKHDQEPVYRLSSTVHTHEIFFYCSRFCLALCTQITLHTPQNERKNNTNDILFVHIFGSHSYSTRFVRALDNF